jgi:hypothetical protein
LDIIFRTYDQKNYRSLLLAYYKRLTSTDEKIKNDACYNWCQLELKIAKFYNNDSYNKDLNDFQKIIPLARIECHFFINNKKFMKSDNYIIENSYLLKNIPIVISQSRYDNMTYLCKIFILSKNIIIVYICIELYIIVSFNIYILCIMILISSVAGSFSFLCCRVGIHMNP